jgi:glycosyltransferase involved in cell wall biosynthesis
MADQTDIRASVVCVTYRHEKYIGRALDGFLMQKTGFDFEIIVADDCSPDGTAGIIREYQARFPQKIKPVLRDKNIGANRNFNDALYRARGRYIALCEGDDYWTDPGKLQRQVDFLESHPDYSLCFHRVKLLYRFPWLHWPWSNRRQRETTSLADLCRKNYIYTASAVFRNLFKEPLPPWFETAAPTDWPLYVLIARHGRIKYLNRTMAAYRIHQAGSWGGSCLRDKWQREIQMLRQLGEFLDRPDCQPAIEEAIREREEAMAEKSDTTAGGGG